MYAVMLSPRTDYRNYDFTLSCRRHIMPTTSTHLAVSIMTAISFLTKQCVFSPNNETVSPISGHFCGYHVAQNWTDLKNASVLFPNKDLEMLL